MIGSTNVLKAAAAIAFVAAQFIPSTIHAQLAKSEWVKTNTNNKLEYKTLTAGDRIIDFSYAGYMGGGVALPNVPVIITLSPVDGDNSTNIQQAIDKVAAMPVVKGFRGAVLLKPGTYDCEKTISINTSGIVLKGSGANDKGSIFNMTGKPHTCIVVNSKVDVHPIGHTTYITDAYVPSGSFSFNVVNGKDFKQGDTIQIVRPVTPEWVSFMGMDKLVRDGKKQTWISGDITATFPVAKVEGNKITLTIPLTDNYDAKYTGLNAVTVSKVKTTGELSQIGIEDMRIVSAPQAVTINDAHNKAFTIVGAADCWVKNLDILNTVNSTTVNGKRITVDHVSIVHEQPSIGSAKPADLVGNGQQVLFNKCYVKGDNVFYFATHAKVTGPVVLLNCRFEGTGWIQPHMRWATGLLVDNCEVPNGGIDFMNRGEMGSGHGWAVGWAVAWNSNAKSFLNQMPPGAANWVIGGKGERQKRAIPFDEKPDLPEGIYDSYGKPVTPGSLYLAQLEDRLGKKALKNIGY